MHDLVINSIKYQYQFLFTHKIVNYHKALLEMYLKVVGKENKNAWSRRRWRRHRRKWKIRVALTDVEKSHHQTIRENSNIQYSLKKSLSQVTGQLSISVWMHGPPKQSYLLFIDSINCFKHKHQCTVTNSVC